MKETFKLTWRVPDTVWMDDARFAEFAALLTRHPDTADEAAFFVAEPSSGAYHPLDIVRREAGVFEKRAQVLRAAGIRAGFNVWPTFGTGSAYSRSEHRPDAPFRRMVGCDGAQDASLVCPVSPEFLEYTRQKYTVLAGARPDFIWVDDDTRLTHLDGVPYPCFCPACVQGFEGGRFAGREELVAALNAPENAGLRRAWCAYGADRLARYCAEVRAAVDAVDPAIDTPFMTVGPTHTTFSGDFIEKCMKALRSRRGRPGHGFYWDDRPDGMLGKCLEAGRQVVRYPGSVQEILYEEESCPCTYLEKSLRTRRNEVSLALAAGCTGVAFNHLNPNPGMDRLLAREADGLHLQRPVWQRYTEFVHDLPWVGLWPAFSEWMAAGMDCEKGWFREDDPAYDITRPEALGRAGLPLTADAGAACAVLLAGKTLRAFSVPELEKIFSGNVFLDAAALEELEKLGLGDLCGVLLGDAHPCTAEKLTTHPFNGPFAGFSHNGIFLPARDLKPLDESVESLAYSVDGYGTRYGCCLSKYENALGGRVIVAGYDPWRFAGDPHKLWQAAAIADWFGSPLRLRRPDPLCVSRLVPLERTDGVRAAVLLVNASLDESLPCELVLRGAMTRASACMPDDLSRPLGCRREDGALCVSLPALQPWQTLTVLAE